MNWSRKGEPAEIAIVPIYCSVELLEQLSDWSEAMQMRATLLFDEWVLEFKRPEPR